MKTKKPPQKVTRSIRFDGEDLKRAKSIGLNLSQICRDALKAGIKNAN